MQEKTSAFQIAQITQPERRGKRKGVKKRGAGRSPRPRRARRKRKRKQFGKGEGQGGLNERQGKNKIKSASGRHKKASAKLGRSPRKKKVLPLTTKKAGRQTGKCSLRFNFNGKGRKHASVVENWANPP